MVARIRPIAKIVDVAMFNGIVVNVVESCPEIVFVADARVPIIVPNLTPPFSFPAVEDE
jgi:hypothetical protein